MLKRLLFVVLLLSTTIAQANDAALCSAENMADCLLSLTGPVPAITSSVVCDTAPQTVVYTVHNGASEDVNLLPFIQTIEPDDTSPGSTVTIDTNSSNSSCYLTTPPSVPANDVCTLSVTITPVDCTPTDFPEFIARELQVLLDFPQAPLFADINVRVQGLPNCTAVGYYIDLGERFPLSYTSSNFGVDWDVSTSYPPALGSLDDELQGVACNFSTGSCTAVGFYYNGTKYLASSYTSSNFGSTWAVSTTLPPAEGSSHNFLNAVACNSAGVCTAVGYYANGPFVPLSYTSTNFGVTWTVSTTLPPAQGSSHNYLNAVACDSTGDCTAVGQYFNGARFIPLSYTSSDFGDTWAVSTTLPPAQGPNSPGIENIVKDVVCNSTGNCTAVGYYFDGPRQVPWSYTSSDSGVTWANSTTPPQPYDSTNDFRLNSVDCDSVGNCTAVGEYFNGSSFLPLSYISINFGVDWADSMTIPPAESAIQNSLTSVACNSTGSCAAGGFYDSGGFAPLTSTSSDFGDNWVTSVTLPLAQGSDSFITSIDCNE